jgi:hypothetical protein
VTPDAVVLARHLLADLDQEVRSIEAKLVNGAPQDWTAYRELVARRSGVLATRRALVERLSSEQRQFLGLRSD